MSLVFDEFGYIQMAGQEALMTAPDFRLLPIILPTFIVYVCVILHVCVKISLFQDQIFRPY